MGLLDAFTNMNPEQTQGLLAAAAQMLQQSGPSRTPTSFGQIAGGGMQAYHGSMEAARRRKLEEEQAAQQSKLFGLKIRDSESDFANQEIARKRAADLQNFFKNRGAPGAPAPTVEPTAEVPVQLGSTPQASIPGMLPRMPATPSATATPNVFEQRMKLAEDLRAQGFSAEADAQEAAALKFQPEVKSWEKVKVNGKVLLKPYFNNGTSGEPVTAEVAEKLHFADAGGRTIGQDAYSGAIVSSVNKTLTPDQVNDNRLGWAKFGLDKERLAVDKSGGAQKPMPATALKMQQAELDALGTAAGVQMEISRVQSKIKDGKLGFGLVGNAVNTARNALGVSSEESRNFASFKATLEKMRNDSLRLNAGVQTDGDAQRAWNELMANINDQGVVEQRLQEIFNINARAVQLRKMNVDGIRANYGRDPLDTSKYEPPATPEAGKGDKTIKRTGTLNGRKVVEYSDGSTEYAN